MKISFLDDRTIKVILFSDDLDELDITYHEMDYGDRYTRRILSELIERISLETDAELSGGKLFIEAFPYLDGGCVLYISILDEEADCDSGNGQTRPQELSIPLIFKFNRLEPLTGCCKHLLKRFYHLILKSAVYRYDNAYFLVIYTYYKLDKKIISVIGEFGVHMGKSEIKHSFYKEHGRLIAAEGAIEKIAEYC